MERYRRKSGKILLLKKINTIENDCDQKGKKKFCFFFTKTISFTDRCYVNKTVCQIDEDK